jgi:hypothetical protein
LSGRFWPVSRPLFHGACREGGDEGIAVCMVASLIPTAPLPARADGAACQSIRMPAFGSASGRSARVLVWRRRRFQTFPPSPRNGEIRPTADPLRRRKQRRPMPDLRQSCWR